MDLGKAERSRIAKDIHDDLGGSLTQIKLLFELTQRKRAEPEKVDQLGEEGLAATRQIIKSMDEIVWAVDPERDTVASVARYLASYAEEYLAGLKVVCRVQIPNSFPDQVVSGEVRHHLFLAVKEALNNAVRHGGAVDGASSSIRYRDGLRLGRAVLRNDEAQPAADRKLGRRRRNYGELNRNRIRCNRSAGRGDRYICAVIARCQPRWICRDFDRGGRTHLAWTKADPRNVCIHTKL